MNYQVKYLEPKNWLWIDHLGLRRIKAINILPNLIPAKKMTCFKVLKGKLHI